MLTRFLFTVAGEPLKINQPLQEECFAQLSSELLQQLAAQLQTHYVLSCQTKKTTFVQVRLMTLSNVVFVHALKLIEYLKLTTFLLQQVTMEDRFTSWPRMEKRVW